MLSIWICSQQDSILVLCVSPACQLYVFWWLPPGGIDSQVNTSEQVSSDDHQMSVINR